MGLRIATLVKQIPALEEMQIGDDGRLERSNCSLEMNPYCRRAVAAAVEIAQQHTGSVTVFTLGPPAAEDVLREAVAWGRARGVEIRGIHICGAEFAGSDALATSSALAKAIKNACGPNEVFDLIIAGRKSVDSDTGQVPPGIAELLGLPLLTGVASWTVSSTEIHAICDHDNSILEIRAQLPAFVTTAERLTDPAKVDAKGCSAVPASLITRVNATELGPGPWGDEGSMTWVGAPVKVALSRAAERNPAINMRAQVDRAIKILVESHALGEATEMRGSPTVPAPVDLDGPIVCVIVEPGLESQCRKLVMTGAVLASKVDGHCAVFSFENTAFEATLDWGRWGVGQSIEVSNASTEEDASAALTAWAIHARPWAILALSTMWGREVAGRSAAALGAGMIGDSVSLAVSDDGRLLGSKSALGGAFVVPIGYRSDIQIATIRSGLLPPATPRALFTSPKSIHIGAVARHRIDIIRRSRDESIDEFETADAIVGVGRGVNPDEYSELGRLTALLAAPLAASRKVTDAGWLPRGRQVGITGRSVTPRLYISIGASGKFNHTIGFRNAGIVLAINADPTAPIFDAADIGIIGDWREVVPLLVEGLAPHMIPT